MRLQLFLFFLLSISDINAQVDIYNTTLQMPSGKTILMSEFKGKDLIIACINPSDHSTGQKVEYQELVKQFKDRGLVLIVCITEDTSRVKTRSGIREKNESKQRFSTAFTSDWVIVAAMPDKISGSLQEWLMSENKNGIISKSVLTNGLKYHINRHGQLVGIYSSQILPMNTDITESIKNNF